ncbi:MAG: ATP-dependent Clp protease ATP-binding subunit [Candidatus Pacebacteria bacterium]|nr:ATP-dependent Clp protease ATP-binding subunit [Candidatus Paceibacterota bacterium]
MFNLKATGQYCLVKKEKFFLFLKWLGKLSFIGFVWCLIILVYRCLNEPGFLSQPLGLGIIFFDVFLLSKYLNLFFDDAKKTSPRKNLQEALEKGLNLAPFLNFNSTKYIARALKKNPAPSSSILLYHFLDEKNPKMVFIFSRLLVDIKKLKSEVQKIMNNGTEEEFENIISEAGNIALKRGYNLIKEGDIISALSELEPTLKQILIDLELKKEDIDNLSWWIEAAGKKIREAKRFWDYENLLKHGSIGRDWAFGYTVGLDKFSIDWTREIETRGFEEIVGHDQEMELTENILSRKGARNALIVGNPGTGRSIIVHALIKKSLSGKSTKQLNSKRFIQLDLVALASNVDSFEQSEKIIAECLNEAEKSGNVVLIINDFHDFVGGEKKAGLTDVSSILLPYLSNSAFPTICITNYEGFHKYIEKKPELSKLFDKVEVKELTPEQTMFIIENKVFGLEQEYNKFISYPALKEIIRLSDKYIPYSFPQKAISLLKDAFAFSNKYANDHIILAEHVDQIVCDKTQIPVGKIRSKEKETLLNLENILKKRIVSQEEAIKEISSALRRARSGIQNRKGPMGSFLFMGPTGVGKTETAKALAEAYFGSEDRLIRLDMSEFQRLDDIPRIIGSEAQEGILTTKVKEDPFSLVLLDEIEKAHPDILNLFLQVLDEGYVNDNVGRKVNFGSTIIIATSNAGYQIILDALNNKKEMSEIKKELLDYIFRNGTFRPEFINRFDGVIVFKSLNQEDLIKITQLQLEKMQKTLSEKHIELAITDELKKKIVELSYNPVFGAREIKREIQDKIENVIAKALLGDKIKNGDKIQIDPNTFEIITL